MKKILNFFTKFEPADWIATLIIVGGFALKFNGGDGLTTALMTSVSFYYFGQKLQKRNLSDTHQIANEQIAESKLKN